MTFKKRIKIKSSGCTFVLKWLYLEICCDIEESLLGVDVASFNPSTVIDL
jgi:hypothetical protein